MGQPKDCLWDSEPRTLLKHQAYRRYLGCWMGKVCRRFPMASIVDAFAGPGGYRDGPDGSPLVIAKTFMEHVHRERFNTLRLLCVEQRADRRDYLQGLMTSLAAPPQLEVTVFPAGGVGERFSEVSTAAHVGARRVPTLWILDPFDYSSMPFELVRACLRNPHDEVLITVFVDELYRFCEDATKHEAFTRHFGGQHWRTALEVSGQAPRKTALMDAYQQGLESLPGVTAHRLEVACTNETPRYALMFATHHAKGLECFTSTAWALDPYLGRGVHEQRIGMDTLFDDAPEVNPLRSWVVAQAGRAVSFRELSAQAARQKFKDSHLRTVLDELAHDGQAVREHPLQATTPWPQECTVRIYSPERAAVPR